MSLITLFAMPKPFHIPHISIIQRNAIKSWTKLGPECEIILLGDDEGVGEIAQELGLRHIPQVERNEFGTPLISSLFNLAMEASNTDILAYVNSDIILLSDFISSVRQIHIDAPFLLVGLRWNLDVTELINFDTTDWEISIRRQLVDRGNQDKLFGGSDYFVFRKGMWGEIPPIALGRFVWDNWLIYGARTIGAPVIDATATVTAIHQSHDYSHHPQGKGGISYGLETWQDLQIVGGPSHLYTLFDANLLLTSKGLHEPQMTEERLRQMQASRNLEASWIATLEQLHTN